MRRDALLRWAVLAVAGVMLTASPTLSGQAYPPYQAPTKDGESLVLKTGTNLVLLDVSVRDSKGGFASGLQKDNFEVFEDKKPVTIKAFNNQDAPVTVGLVVDNSGSMRPKRPEVVTAALAFVKESNPQDEVFVVNFNDRVTLGLPESAPFSDDIPTLRNALLNNPVAGRTALYDAVKVGLGQLNKGQRDKKTLVVISDGGDNASEATLDEIARLAQESVATIYTVGIFSPGDKDRNPGVLKKLANLTGGEALFPDKLDDMIGVCRKIAKDIRTRYTIGFVPLMGAPDGKVHHIQVHASAPDRGKLLVRTRTSYIATERRTAGSSGTPSAWMSNPVESRTR